MNGHVNVGERKISSMPSPSYEPCSPRLTQFFKVRISRLVSLLVMKPQNRHDLKLRQQSSSSNPRPRYILVSPRYYRRSTSRDRTRGCSSNIPAIERHALWCSIWREERGVPNPANGAPPPPSIPWERPSSITDEGSKPLWRTKATLKQENHRQSSRATDRQANDAFTEQTSDGN